MATTEEQQIIQDRDREIANIRARVEWTEEAKNERIAAVHEWARNEVHAVREHEREQRDARLERAKREVFRVPTGNMATGAEVSQIYNGFRSAWAEVKAATSVSPDNPVGAAETLEEILDQAERTGDPHLARDAYHRSIDLGIQGVVDRYLENNPKEAGTWERYTMAAEEMGQSRGFEHLLANALTEQLNQ